MAWFILYQMLNVYKWLIIIRAVMSWFASPHSRHPFVDFIRRVTDPVIQPISQIIPPMGGVDLSPIAAFFAITLLQYLIIGLA